MAQWKIYYNPRCSTCRSALDLLRARGVAPEVIEYLATPPSPAELGAVLDAAGLEPEAIVRKKEPLYSQLGLAEKRLSRGQWLRVLSENPILIERPIVVKDRRAVLARPPQKLEELF